MRLYLAKFPLIALNLMAIAIYGLCFFSFELGINESLMYSTVDSKSYLAVANWISHNIEANALEYRPILYPLFLVIFNKIGGVHAIFVFQSLLWLVTVNLIFNSVLKLVNNWIWAYISAIIIITNISLIALTRHALTEVSTTFFLALFVNFITRNAHRVKQLYFIHGCILFMAVLTVIKPVFSIPLYLLLSFLIFYAKNYIKTPINLMYLFLVLTPIIIQMTIIKSEFGQFKISNVGSKAINEYILPQGIQYINKVNRNDAIAIAHSISNSEKIGIITKHSNLYYTLFLKNLEDNIKASAPFLSVKNGSGNGLFNKYMVFVNIIYYYIHLIFIPALLYVLLHNFNKKEYKDLILVGGLYLLGLFLVLITGISFWQGDRLVLPSIAIWSVLYPYIGSKTLKALNKNIRLIVLNFKYHK